MFNIIDVDLDKNYFKAKLTLHRPNKRLVANLNEAYNRVLKVKLGNINELSFDIPYNINRGHNIIKNPLIDKLKLGFIVKLEFKGQEEYFVINNDSKTYSNQGETVSYSLKSLAYRLGKFDVYEYTTDTENLTSTVSN